MKPDPALTVLAAAGIAVTLSALPGQGKAESPVDLMLSKGPGEFVCNAAQTLCAENLRVGASDFDLEDAPGHSSHGRVAVLVHGGDKNFLKATFLAAQNLAEQGIEMRYVLLPDNDADPSDARVDIFSNGLPAVEATMRNPLDRVEFEEIARLTVGHGLKAYEVMLEEQQRQAESGALDTEVEAPESNLPDNDKGHGALQD